MSRLRVINLGLPKSGTTTLAKALRKSGLKVADWKVRRFQSTRPDVAGQFLGDLIYRGYFEQGDPLHFLDAFDALSEINVIGGTLNRWPQSDWGLLSTLIEKHPGAKFILSYRDPDAQAGSMMRWTNLGKKRLPMFDVPGLPGSYGRDVGHLARWIDGHNKFCRRVFAGSGDFLEYDILDPAAPDKIGAFLNMPIRWWGTTNENPTNTPADDPPTDGQTQDQADPQKQAN